MHDFIENNKVEISGELCGRFEYSHEVYGEGFYSNKLKIDRISGESDFIPITVSERMIAVDADDWNGVLVAIKGQFRSYNKHEDRNNKLILSVFVREIEILDELPSNNSNSIVLDGYICKEPIYRKTPLGREIADLFLAVNRPYGKSDYIPCISWGRNARFASCFEIGNHLKICGRIQSREYRKKISDTETETRTAYEVSVSKLEIVEDEEQEDFE